MSAFNSQSSDAQESFWTSDFSRGPWRVDRGRWPLAVDAVIINDGDGQMYLRHLARSYWTRVEPCF